MNRLHVYARLIRCRALAWDCVQIVAGRVAVEAWHRAREARESSAIVQSRAEATQAALRGVEQ